jgi:hypothetical protein
MITDVQRLIDTLSRHGVEFIIVGGFAAVAHGSARVTNDIDIVYGRTPGNVKRLVESLTPFNPYLRGAPPGLPFDWSAETILRGLNFTLTTAAGDIDLLGEIVGGGGFTDLAGHTVALDFFGHRCLCLDLPTLIRVKRAAGRPRDLEAIAELEALHAEGGKRS